MTYIPHTEAQTREMLDTIGVSSIEGLFQDIKPSLRPESFNIPEGISESQVIAQLHRLSAKNATNLMCFLGGGFYDHYIPTAVDAVVNRSEFYTAYTPYQPECSQGWLQAIYEYQTAICQLTGLDYANASLYDGGTALYEAAMMAIRATGRNKIIMDSGLSLIYRTMLYTYTSNLNIEFIETPVVHGQSCREEIYKHLDDKTAAVIVQNPNFFGAVDNHSDIVHRAHSLGALAIMSVYPISLGLLQAPGEIGIDIATGEGQSLGIPLSFGGPYLGFMACRKSLLRKMPGRIVGATVDRDHKRGFVLTLQAREQHIRRENATSNICSNEALCALRAVVYLSLIGKSGIAQLARLNHDKSEYAKGCIGKIPGVTVKRSSPTFNEFTVVLNKNANVVVEKMIDRGFAAGFPLGRFYKGMNNYLLIAITEKRTKQDIDKFTENLEKVLCS
jgi:glycine dehydrogenase subunit 1